MNLGEPYRAACALTPAAARIAAHLLYRADDLPVDWRYVLHGALYARGGGRGLSWRDRIAVAACRWPRTRVVTRRLEHAALLEAFEFVRAVNVAARAPEPVSWWQVAPGAGMPRAPTHGWPHKGQR